MFDRYYSVNSALAEGHYVDEKKLTALVSLQMLLKEDDGVSHGARSNLTTERGTVEGSEPSSPGV